MRLPCACSCCCHCLRLLAVLSHNGCAGTRAEQTTILLSSGFGLRAPVPVPAALVYWSHQHRLAFWRLEGCCMSSDEEEEEEGSDYDDGTCRCWECQHWGPRGAYRGWEGSAADDLCFECGELECICWTE